MGRVEMLRDQVTTLYNEPESRPAALKSVIEKVGIEKVLTKESIERVAALSTLAGITAEVDFIKETAAPYMEMSKKELVTTGATLVNEKIIQPAKEVATPYVEPYVVKTKEVAAPYIQKGLDTKEAVMQDERVIKAVAELKDKFAAVKERPSEVALDLKNKTIDLIKYEKVTEYREYVCSEQFVTDTTKLVKEDLPALAKEAARKGADSVQSASTVLSVELTAASSIVADAWKKGREEQPDVRSWEALRSLAATLVAEIQAGLLGRIEENQLDKKYAEMVARLKAVFGLALSKISLSPSEEEEEPPTGKPADDEDAKEVEAEEVEAEEVEAEEVESTESEEKPTSM